MKKILLTIGSLALAQAASAQVEIGLKVSPSISYFRASSQNANFQGNGSKIGFGGGVFVDYFFGENYAFNTGLFLTGKGGTYSYNEAVFTPGGTPKNVSYKLGIDYLEVPLTIKLFTNEIATDTRLYFQLGPSVAFPVGARIGGEKFFVDPATGNSTKALDHIHFVDFNILGSIGAEYQLGKSTKALVGISYHHGLTNIDTYYNDRGFSEVTLKNSVFALDLGLKF